MFYLSLSLSTLLFTNSLETQIEYTQAGGDKYQCTIVSYSLKDLTSPNPIDRIPYDFFWIFGNGSFSYLDNPIQQFGPYGHTAVVDATPIYTDNDLVLMFEDGLNVSNIPGDPQNAETIGITLFAPLKKFKPADPKR